MVLAVVGLTLTTMVGPLDEGPVVRISRPGGGGPEFVRQIVVGGLPSRGGIVVPGSAVGGGGAVTVVGASETVSDTGSDWSDGAYGAEAVHTEQLMRAFGYDRSSFGYTTINWPGGGWGGNGWGGHHHPHRPTPPVDPRIVDALRNLTPIESKFPPVPGR